MDPWVYIVIGVLVLCVFAVIYLLIMTVRSLRSYRSEPTEQREPVEEEGAALIEERAPEPVPQPMPELAPEPTSAPLPGPAPEPSTPPVEPFAGPSVDDICAGLIANMESGPPAPAALAAVTETPHPLAAPIAPIPPPAAEPVVDSENARDVPEYTMTTPVEMWFGDLRIGVKAGSRTCEQFQGFADVLFDELARAREGR